MADAVRRKDAAIVLKAQVGRVAAVIVAGVADILETAIAISKPRSRVPNGLIIAKFT